ncbi:multicopper oxidase-domain-containing protein [Apiospora sp. TS-2023a]
MGWFKVTLEFVLQVTQLNPFSPIIIDQDAAQKPLGFPKPGPHGPASPFNPWRRCPAKSLLRVPLSRAGGKRDPTASAPSFTQYDVRTNYETLKNTPKGITREYWLDVTENSDYPDGVAGPLVIHGPSSADYDIDLGPLMISDWVHETAFVAYEAEITNSTTSLPPATDSIVVNDVDPAKLNPIVPWCVDQHPQNNVTRDTFEAGKPADETIDIGPPGSPYVHWVLGDEPMWLNFDEPTILNINESIHNPNYRIVEGTTSSPLIPKLHTFYRD